MRRHQQLIRLDFEDGFDQVNTDALIKDYRLALQATNVVVLSDYGKGTLHDVARFIELAVDQDKPVLVDPKGTDFSIYRQATLMTPNLGEFETVVGRCTDQQQLVERGMNLLDELALSGLLITKGEQGMTLLSQHHEPLHLPTQDRKSVV